MILHVLPWDSKGNHGSVRKRAPAIQCHRGGATCLVASDGSLVIYADSERGWVGNSILYLASEEGCLPLGLPRSAMRTREVMWNFVIVGITQVAIFFAFLGRSSITSPGNWGNFFCASTRACFHVWCTICVRLEDAEPVSKGRKTIV